MDPHLLDLRSYLAVAEELRRHPGETRVFVSQPPSSKRSGGWSAISASRCWPARRPEDAKALTAAGEVAPRHAAGR